MDRATQGEYFLDGNEISDYPEKEKARLRNEKFGFVVQDFALINEMTVYENVRLPLRYSRKRLKEERIYIENILKDLEIEDEPDETGKTPEENAICKAGYYGKYFDLVICNDSGLYFEELSLEDERQPGLNVRTPMGMNRLSDEEMIEYYSNLIGELGGKVSAYYLDGIAVYNNGRISSFMDRESAKNVGAFYMIDKASTKRFEGWPLDSLSISKETGRYFVEGSDSESKENIIYGEYEKRIVGFLKEALGIK